MPEENELPDDHATRQATASESRPQGVEREPNEPLQLATLEEAIERARDELARLQAAYARARGVARGELPELEQRMNAWLREGLELVRKYPGRSLLAAALCGFFVGKLLQRAS